MKTDSNRNYFMRHGLHMNIVGKEVIAQQTAATCTALFQGKIEDPISLYWKDYYNEIDNNLISNTNDDQQNITCQDNTIRMLKRHKKPPVTKNDDFLW
jgi:hypothetical protein